MFPFDAATDWPRPIAGKTMDTYHRWMEVMIRYHVELSGASVPVGFNERGLPMGLQIVGPNHGELACLHSRTPATKPPSGPKGGRPRCSAKPQTRLAFARA